MTDTLDTTFGIEFEGCLKLNNIITSPSIRVKLNKINKYTDIDYINLWIEYF